MTCASAEDLSRPLRIRDVTVDSPLVLGPMAGTTNRVYRLLCRRGGAGLVCSEMLSINAIAQGSERTERMMRVFEVERPVSMQLFGSEPAVMADAAPAVEAAGADVIDINMGCSVPKVRRTGAGVALMKDRRTAAALTAAAVGAVRVPVTVKIRAGVTGDDDGYVDVARAVQDAGAAAIAVHWRAGSEGFTGAPRWERIERVARVVDVPVIGNGDVTEPDDARRMMRETGCDAVMVARGASGRPWIFGRMAAALAGEPVPPEPEPAGRLGVALLHAQMLVMEMGERIALHQMRTQMHHYVRGLPWARRFRSEANDIERLSELRALVERYVRVLRQDDDGAGADAGTRITAFGRA